MKHTSEEIKNRLSNIGEAIGNIALDYITDLEKENAELKEQNRKLLESCEGATMMYKDLCKAKEIIKEMLSILPKENIEGIYEIIEQAEQFLRENK